MRPALSAGALESFAPTKKPSVRRSPGCMLRRLLGAVEDMASNHAAPQHVSGGVGGACAAAVASTEVDFAMGTDHLAGLRV